MYLTNVNKLNPIVKYYHIKTIAMHWTSRKNV